MQQQLPKRTSLRKILANPDNCWPDWQDESQYPSIENTSNRQWAWEFLRRNREYQESWEDLTNQFDRKDIERSELVATFYDKFGIIAPYPPHPLEPNPDQLRLSFITEAVSFITHKKESKIAITLDGSDSHYDIKSQLVRAQYRLASYIKHYEKINSLGITDKTGSSPMHYRIYLRILDAKIRGRSNREIAKIIHLNAAGDELDKKVRDQLASAESLRDGGFLIIPKRKG